MGEMLGRDVREMCGGDVWERDVRERYEGET